MIHIFEEKSPAEFNGTIIDIETIGTFNERYPEAEDLRRYQWMSQVIFGYINRHGLYILYVTQKKDIPELNTKVAELVDTLERPLYAFNAAFEMCMLFRQLGNKQINFEGELQNRQYESKINACRDLGISGYGDPFDGKGYYCTLAWERGEIDKAVAHNRACLLKERDILLKRGFRKANYDIF
jgi:hypothetical protein